MSPRPEQWPCQLCTFVNHGEVPVCEMCERPRNYFKLGGDNRRCSSQVYTVWCPIFAILQTFANALILMGCFHFDEHLLATNVWIMRLVGIRKSLWILYFEKNISCTRKNLTVIWNEYIFCKLVYPQNINDLKVSVFRNTHILKSLSWII